jgi:hypothetical protein
VTAPDPSPQWQDLAPPPEVMGLSRASTFCFTCQTTFQVTEDEASPDPVAAAVALRDGHECGEVSPR